MTRKRRFLTWLAALAALAALLCAAAVVVIRSQWFRQWLRERIVREIETVTGGRAELAGFHFDPRRMEVRVTGFVLHGREDPAEPPLFRAAAIRAKLKLLSLIRPSVDLRALELARPEIHVIVFQDGSTNLPAPRRRPARKSAVQQILDLAVDDFRIEDGQLIFQERRIPIRVRAEHFRTWWTFNFARPEYDGSFSAERLETSLNGFRTMPLSCEARLRLDAARLEIASASFALPNSRVEVRGAVENWAAPRAWFEYAGRARLAEVREALGVPQLPPRGDVRLKGRAELGAGEPWTAGRVEASGLLLEHRGLRLAGVQATADFDLRPQRLEWRNLRAVLLGGRIAGRGAMRDWRNLTFEASFQNLRLGELAAVAGYASSPYQALLSGTLALSADTSAGPEKWRIRTAADLVPGDEGEPLRGRIEASYDGRTRTLVLGPSDLATRASHIEVSGTAGKSLDVSLRTTSWDDLERLRSLVPALRNGRIPVKISLASAAFRGAVRGPLEKPEIEGRLSVEGLRVEEHAFDALETDVEASAKGLLLRRLRLSAADSVAKGWLRLGLDDWRASQSSTLSASLTLESGDLARMLAAAGRKSPVEGHLQASIMASGSVGQPQWKARWSLARGAVYGQDFDRLEGEAAYRDRVLTIRRLQASLGSGRVTLSGAYSHEGADVMRGRLSFEASAERFDASALRFVRETGPQWRANLSGKMRGTVRTEAGQISLEALDGQLRFDRVAWRQMLLGSLVAEASTKGSVLALQMGGELGGAPVEAHASFRLEPDSPGSGSLRFERIELAEWLERLSEAGQPARREMPLEILAAGKLDFEVASLAKGLWKGTLRLDGIELRPRAAPKAAAFSLRNPEPWLVEFDPKEARIRQARLAGRKTELELTGGFRFGTRYPFNLRCRGTFDLVALQDLDPDLRTGGQVVLDATLRGPLNRPDLYGRVELLNAFVNYADFPNGLDKVNGVLFLYRDRAMIEKLTAESGGGKVSLQGFVTLGDAPGYWLQLRASDVRVRYPEGVSSTVNAALALTGHPAQSVLSGELTITRAAFHPQTDLGSMLVRSAQRPERPSHPQLENVRLDVRIRTAPQVRLETSLTRSLQAEADLRLRGTALRPALLGRALISQGEILFFGNRYSIDSGEILFVNPARIEPVVNLHLQTRVRGVEVTLNINGPLNKTTVTYRSDPPLPFSDVVALLATGRAPSTAPGLSTARSEFAQSWEQAGASALVSQAITSPLAGRLQRFLGVSRLKIDPTVRGIENTPEAHLTLEQQITPDVTLVYITNLARAQQQTIRLEWDFTRNFSALAVREANGLFGVDFLYKKRFR